jgi:hypothetical protein
MANATHIPAIVWSVIWIVIAVGILGLAMRLYASSRKPQFQLDRPLDPIPAVFPATVHESRHLR